MHNLPNALKNRSLLSLAELSARDVEQLLALAASLKRAKIAGSEHQMLRGMHIAALGRDRSAGDEDPLEIAAFDQGAQVVHVDSEQARRDGASDGIDIATLFGRLYDAVEVRAMPRAQLRDFARRCPVPVYSDLGHGVHPVRVIADLMTMRELSTRPLTAIGLTLIGDPRGTRHAPLVHIALQMGLDLRIAAPREHWPTGPKCERLRRLAAAHGGRLSFHDAPQSALAGSDFCYRTATDVTARPASGDPELQDARGAGEGQDVRVEQQANRVHAAKALLVATLA